MLQIVFWFHAVVAIAAAVLCITRRSPVASALWLVVTLFATAVMYVLLDAHFIAAIQVLVYSGAIMVLFLFVVMLLNASQENTADWDRSHPLRQPAVARFGGLLALLLVVQLAWALLSARGLGGPVAAQGDVETVSSVRVLGRVLFTDYVFAFEATSILILVAMVGAVVLARREGD